MVALLAAALDVVEEVAEDVALAEALLDVFEADAEELLDVPEAEADWLLDD